MLVYQRVFVVFFWFSEEFFQVKPVFFLWSQVFFFRRWADLVAEDPAFIQTLLELHDRFKGKKIAMVRWVGWSTTYIYILYIYIIYLFKMIMFNSYVSLLETNAESWVWPVILTHVMISQFMAKLLSLRWIMMTFTQGFFHWWQWKHGNIEVITYKDGLKHMLFSHMSFPGRASMNITRVTWSRIEYQGFDPWQDGWFSWPRDPAGGCNFFFQVIWGWVNTYQ